MDTSTQLINLPVNRFDIWKKYPNLKQTFTYLGYSLQTYVPSTLSVTNSIHKGFDDIDQYTGRRIVVKRLEYTGYAEVDLTSWETQDWATKDEVRTSGNFMIRVFAWVDTRRDSRQTLHHQQLCPLWGTQAAPLMLNPQFFPKECVLLSDKLMVLDAALQYIPKNTTGPRTFSNGRTIVPFHDCIDLDIEQIYGPVSPEGKTNWVMSNPIYISVISNCRNADISGVYRGRPNVWYQTSVLYLDA